MRDLFMRLAGLVDPRKYGVETHALADDQIDDGPTSDLRRR